MLLWRNFLYGVGTLASLFPFRHESAIDRSYPFQSDADALAHDWAVLGGDFQQAMDTVKKDVKHKG